MATLVYVEKLTKENIAKVDMYELHLENKILENVSIPRGHSPP